MKRLITSLMCIFIIFVVYGESWEDVLACMKDGRVFYSEEKGDCGERLIAVNFSSPQWTWEKMCGRSGLLYICPVCKRQVKFDCLSMN